MKASQTLINAIKSFESCKLFAYRDFKGIATIGFGHTGKDVYMGKAITMKQAEQLLVQDLSVFEKYVNALGVCKTQGQFDALVDFAYNVGTSRLNKSTLLQYIKQGKPVADIQTQFLVWNKSGGKVLNGLTKRRQWEAKRWTE